MPSIIDVTYFENANLYIPNNKDLNTEPTTAPSIRTGLEVMIDIYERELLLGGLGVDLYSQLQLALPDLDAADPKWKKLVEGEIYTNDNGDKKISDGLIGFQKQSFVAFYVFAEYMRNDNEVYTTTGVVKNTAKNAENVNPTPKFIKAHREFIKGYQGFLFQEPRVLLNGFGSLGLDWRGNAVNVCLLEYLTDKNDLDKTSFPDFEFRFYDELTSFGI